MAASVSLAAISRVPAKFTCCGNRTDQTLACGEFLPLREEKVLIAKKVALVHDSRPISDDCCECIAPVLRLYSQRCAAAAKFSVGEAPSARVVILKYSVVSCLWAFNVWHPLTDAKTRLPLPPIMGSCCTVAGHRPLPRARATLQACRDGREPFLAQATGALPGT
jgi:hypothetical protein